LKDNEINRDMLTPAPAASRFLASVVLMMAQRVLRWPRAKMPDLILMDVALGEMDGWEATQLIKANPANIGNPDRRANGPRSGQRSRQERRGRMFRLRYETGRYAAVTRQNSGLPAR